MLFDHPLDKTVPIPLYFQLKERILAEIKNGSYPPESIIPTEAEICQALGISRTTIRQAITELVTEGWLYRVKSKGTFVSAPKINQDFIKKLESFNDQIQRLGMTPRTEVLKLTVTSADKPAADALRLKEGAPLILLHRRRFADAVPLVVLETYLPQDRCGYLLDHDFTSESLYKTLQSTRADDKILYVQRTIEAVSAGSTDARSLQVKPGSPLLYFTSVGYAKNGVPLEYSKAKYRGDRNKFEVTVVPE